MPEFADDALAGVRYLRTRKEVDPSRIGLIGLSEGGLVAPLAVSRAPDEVAFVVMLSSPAIPMGQAVKRTVELLAIAGGADEGTIRREVAKMTLVVDSAIAAVDSSALRLQLEELIRTQATALPDSLRPTDEDINAEVDGTLSDMCTPYARSVVTQDPREALRRITCPLLALYGSLDPLVDPKENMPEIESALSVAGNPDVTVQLLPNLNHVLQPCVTGLPPESYTIEETISPVALLRISDWILARFGNR